MERDEIQWTRRRLRWALGPHVGSVSGAVVRVDRAGTPRCHVRLQVDGQAVWAEESAPTVTEAIDRAVHRAAASAARALHTRRLLGRRDS